MASASASVIPSLSLGSTSAVHKPAPNTLSWPAHQKSLFSQSPNNLAFSPLSLRPAETRRAVGIVAMATGESSDASSAASDILKGIQEAWDKTEDKLAVGGLGFAALIVLWASTGLISAIDKLPLIPNFFEFVGILFSGWFVYRYLLFKPDREELVKKVENAVAKITGSEV